MPTLQEFITDYIETIGGDYDEVEPQVYDILLPERELVENNAKEEDSGSSFVSRVPSLHELAKQGVLRITYDSEAIPEHPGSQLVSFGTPLVDAVLADAVRRGRTATAYMTGLNLQARDLPSIIRRTVTLPEGFDWTFENVRFLHYPQAVFWFEATFAGDIKEQEVLSVGFDLASKREVRRLDQLLDFERLAPHPTQPLIEANHDDLTEIYLKARQEAVRTVSALSNLRRRELDTRLNKQVSRMQLYYEDLRKELEEQERRKTGRPVAAEAGEGQEKLAKRLETINREESQRITELRQKSALKVTLRLANLLIVQQPKICVQAVASEKRGMGLSSEPMELIWNPLTEQLEAVSCPACGRPTFEFNPATKKQKTEHALICGQCAS
ncbi:MAG: hypothetical protein FWC43_12410 [Planctomycetaceae bacterium]|nr:hypothetical protein [Planctomycetaceae bacterium]